MSTDDILTAERLYRAEQPTPMTPPRPLSTTPDRTPPTRITFGEPPIFVDANHRCEDCGEIHDREKCPRCGSWIGHGFGLAGGGYGLYKYCLNEACDWMWKECLNVDES